MQFNQKHILYCTGFFRLCEYFVGYENNIFKKKFLRFDVILKIILREKEYYL